MADQSIHIMRVALRDDSSIYRDIEIGGGRPLWDLAKAIVDAFDFDFDHAFGFYSGRTDRTLMSSQPKYELFADMGEESDAESVKRTKISEAFPRVGHQMIMLFDYGDEWLFAVRMTGSGKRAPKVRYPRISARVGESPEQYPSWDDEDE